MVYSIKRRRRFNSHAKCTVRDEFWQDLRHCFWQWGQFIAQNHATYPGTLSPLRAPNLKLWSANRGQNKEKKAKTVQSGSRFRLFRLNYIKIISVGDFVDLWKSVTLVTILHRRSRLRLNICSASHFIHASAYGYVSLTIKEDSLKVWYDYVVGKFWLFVNF